MNLEFSKLVIIIGVMACVFAKTVIADDEPAKPASLDELRDAIAAVIEDHGVPAVGIAMADENGPVWIGALGKANLEKDIDADEDTMFRIGSTSKMFVALAILKLSEEGKLSLDDKLANLAPEIAYENQWEDSDPVRIVHLLEHTTGWDDLHLPEYAHNDPTPVRLKQGLDFHPHSRTSRWKPGSRYSYCNSGPPVAAYIIEKITGQDFEAYVIENFFEPMGMDTMTYLLTDDVEEHGATLYTNGNKPEEYWHIIMRPAGSINASVKDMMRFLDFYLNRGAIDGQQLISEASLRRMETAVSTDASKAGRQTGYGLHNYSSVYEQWVYREHNGGVNGGLTELAYLPEAGVGHVIMINSDNGEALREISDLVRGFETRQLAAKTITREMEVSAQHRKIEGLYHPINPRQQISFFLDRIFNVQKLWFDSDRLVKKALFGGEASYFFPVSSTQYKSEKTGLISLVRVTDPLAGDVVHTGYSVLKPTTAVLVYTSFAVVALWGLFSGSSLLFFLVWIVRRLRGKIRPGATIQVRLWPLLASASVAGFTGLVFIGFSDPFKLMGQPSVVSIGIMLLSVAFALFTLLGAHTCIRERKTNMNQFVYWHSTVASCLHVIVAVYLLSFGMIGVRVWA